MKTGTEVWGWTSLLSIETIMAKLSVNPNFSMPKLNARWLALPFLGLSFMATQAQAEIKIPTLDQITGGIVLDQAAPVTPHAIASSQVEIRVASVHTLTGDDDTNWGSLKIGHVSGGGGGGDATVDLFNLSELTIGDDQVHIKDGRVHVIIDHEQAELHIQQGGGTINVEATQDFKIGTVSKQGMPGDETPTINSMNGTVTFQDPGAPDVKLTNGTIDGTTPAVILLTNGTIDIEMPRVIYANGTISPHLPGTGTTASLAT